jgi:hypothetical protein
MSGYRAVAVLCVVLIFLAGFIAAVHFHVEGAGNFDRGCSVCALAHAGVAPVDSGPQEVLRVLSVIGEASTEISHSLLLDSSHFIRPPPLA